MSKHFRPWKIDEVQLLPPAISDFVAKDHLVRFVINLVRETLDLRLIMASYKSGTGQPPFDPRMMTGLLLYAYSQGIYSSRRIAKACRERVDFMAIVALDAPDFRTISEFRKRHLAALGDLFVQVLGLCAQAGLVKLGHVALDGTKIKANASKHKAMSYERMKTREAELQAEVDRWLAAAEAADAEEDAVYGKTKRGDEMPDWVADKQKRLAKIRQAKAELEAEAKAAQEEKDKTPPKYRGGRKPKVPPGEPNPKAQKNFTDPDSAIMKSQGGFIQAYNGQAAVDAKAQVIVAHGLSGTAGDQPHLPPMLDAIEAHLGARPKELSADAGYCSEDNFGELEDRGIRGYVATGRAKHPAGGEANQGGPLTQAMRRRLKLGGRRSRYRLRKQLPEPVFGQIKQARGFRQFLLRGIENVKQEWAIICTAHNLLKLARFA
jgi:transposase